MSLHLEYSVNITWQ